MGKPEATLINSNLIRTDIPGLTQEFETVASLNDRVGRPVYHASLSLPLNYNLDDWRWNQLADQYLERMGFVCNQFILVRHADQAHEHVHIVANRVRLDTLKCVRDNWDYKRSEAVLRGLEQEFGLPAQQSSWQRDQSQPTRRQLERERLTGQPTIKSILQETIEIELLEDALEWQQFLDNLQKNNIQLSIFTDADGQPIGLSYKSQRISFSGSQLGPAYTHKSLAKQFTIPHLTANQVIELKTSIETSYANATSLSHWHHLLNGMGISTIRQRDKSRAFYEHQHFIFRDKDLGTHLDIAQLESKLKLEASSASNVYQVLYNDLAGQILKTNSNLTTEQVDGLICRYLVQSGRGEDIRVLAYSPIAQELRFKSQDQAIAYIRQILLSNTEADKQKHLSGGKYRY